MKKPGADVMIGHDTGCITTLDKNQWIGKAAGKEVDLPILADCQFAALACGAHPYKIVQSHWHASSTETLMEKLGIDWKVAKAEFEDYLKIVEEGRQENLYDPAPDDHLRPRVQGGYTAQMSDPVLIVGGGPSGLAAAHSLASIGQECVLVEKEDQLGGAPILSGYAKLVPSGEWAKDAIGGMVDRVEATGLVKVMTGTTVSEFSGSPGSFSAKLSKGDSLGVSSAILCTGFTHFDSVNKPEWGFGTFPDVVTTTQVEQMISSGQGVRCPSDGRKPKRVAILFVCWLA